MIEFVKVKDNDNHFDVTNVRMDIMSVHRADIIESFCRFLNAIGYSTEDLEEVLRENGMIES